MATACGLPRDVIHDRAEYLAAPLTLQQISTAPVAYLERPI